MRHVELPRVGNDDLKDRVKCSTVREYADHKYQLSRGRGEFVKSRRLFVWLWR